MHVQDIRPSPDPELIDRARCGRPELTTQGILDMVKQITLDLAGTPVRVFKSRLDALIDELVSSLVPFMAAEERVLCDRLDRALGDALRQDHREVRGLVERLSMLSASLERRSLGPPKKEPALLAALQQMTIALGGLRADELAAMRHLDEILTTPEDWALLAARLDAAAIDAREQTILIVRPAIPATAAHVLRNRPDLNAAYAMSLAEIERRSHGGAEPGSKGEPRGPGGGAAGVGSGVREPGPVLHRFWEPEQASEGETNHVARPPSQ